MNKEEIVNEILNVLGSQMFYDFYKYDFEDYITGEEGNEYATEEKVKERIENLFRNLMK